ncbi:hypothetical protein BB987_14660 [Photorhabdus temperata]|nr:hypothetical protein BB987_14660 [Photorhabdus temperata]
MISSSLCCEYIVPTNKLEFNFFLLANGEEAVKEYDTDVDLFNDITERFIEILRHPLYGGEQSQE